MENRHETLRGLALKEHSTDTAPVALFEEGWTGEVPVVEPESDEPLVDGVKSRANKVANVALEAAKRVLVSESDGTPSVMTVQQVRAQRIGRRLESDDTRDDAYSELGGGLQSYYRENHSRRERFDEALDQYQPWHVETRQAIEQYHLWDMTTADFDQMTVRDKKQASLYLFGFIETVQSTRKQITLLGGQLPDGHHLTVRYGKDHTSEEMLSYRDALEAMSDDMESSGIAGHVRAHLGLPDMQNSRFLERRNAKLAELAQMRKRKGSIQIVHSHGKFRVESLKK